MFQNNDCILINIDYDKGEPDTYRGVMVVDADKAKELKRFNTGAAYSDLNSAVKYAKSFNKKVFNLSSIDHFFFDVNVRDSLPTSLFG